MQNFHMLELSNRLASAWAAFFNFKDALCDTYLPVEKRVKLFEAVVVPCALYGCGAWTVTKDMQHKL